MTVDRMLTTFETGYGSYGSAYDMLDTLIGNQRELRMLAGLMLDSDHYSSDLIGDVLCHLPVEDLTELVAKVMHEHDPEHELDDPATEIVTAAELQHPRALTPFLPTLWAYPHLYAGTASPWRGADAAELDRLAAVLVGETDPHQQARVTMALIESEQEPGWRIAREHEATNAILTTAARRERWMAVGVDDGHRPGYRRLFGETSYHLMFPDPPFVTRLPQWLRRRHPTWKLLGTQGGVSTGGRIGVRCAQGHGLLRRLLRLEPVPAGCGVTTRTRLELGYCDQCHDGWQPAFFRHDGNGMPQAIEQPQTVPGISPFEPDDVRAEVTGVLAPTPARWLVQDWAAANGRQNLHRVGGRPTWIQDAAHPGCPGCGRVMPFLAQLAWELLTNGEGITYLMWCDPCAISALVFQRS